MRRKKRPADREPELFERFKADLSAAEVQVPEVWSRGTEPGRLYPGQCFIESFRCVDQLIRRQPDLHKSVWLVHGEYCGWHRHAWVELPGEVVFDGVLQRFYPRAAYHKTLGARPWYKYAPFAAFIIAASMPVAADGTIPYGNWHVYLKLPWANPDDPTEVDVDAAVELLASSGLRPDLAKHRPKKKEEPQPGRGSGGRHRLNSARR